jgi:hypothetical protein
VGLELSFHVSAARSPSWQTSKTYFEQLTDGPPRLGTRVRERTKPPDGKLRQNTEAGR